MQQQIAQHGTSASVHALPKDSSSICAIVAIQVRVRGERTATRVTA